MKRISPIDKVTYARLMQAIHDSEDYEEIRRYASSMCNFASKLDGRANALEKIQIEAKIEAEKKRYAQYGY